MSDESDVQPEDGAGEEEGAQPEAEEPGGEAEPGAGEDSGGDGAEDVTESESATDEVTDPLSEEDSYSPPGPVPGAPDEDFRSKVHSVLVDEGLVNA